MDLRVLIGWEQTQQPYKQDKTVSFIHWRFWEHYDLVWPFLNSKTHDFLFWKKKYVCVCAYFEHLPLLLISPPIRAFPAQVLCFPNGSEVCSANSDSPQGPKEMSGFLNEQLEEMSNPLFQGFFPLGL